MSKIKDKCSDRSMKVQLASLLRNYDRNMFKNYLNEEEVPVI